MQVDLKKLLEICKSKIDKGFRDKEIEDFILSTQGEEVFSELKEGIDMYFTFKEEQETKNEKYWMLIINSLKWGDGEKPFKVNQLLYDLDEVSWTINKNTDLTHRMKKGHKGIIKVSKDNRGLEDRRDEDGNIVDVLVSGIYGFFEVVEDEDGDCTYELENGQWLVNIKVIDNFYRKNKIVDKEEAIKYLGNVFYSIPSREITKKSYLGIIDFQKTL